MQNFKQIVKKGCLAALAAGTFMACQQGAKTPAAGGKDTTGNVTTAGSQFRIAYVDLDSLEAHYDYFKEKKIELEKRQQVIDNELRGNETALRNEYADLQRRAATLTQTEGEAAQRSILQKQQQLELKAQNLRSQYAEQEAKFSEELQKQLNSFLKSFNADKKYAYIFSYRMSATNILYKDEAYDITAEVIKGINTTPKPENK